MQHLLINTLLCNFLTQTTIYMFFCWLVLQWNFNFSNPWFLQLPKNSYQKLIFISSVEHCDSTTDLLNSPISQPIFISWVQEINIPLDLIVKNIQFSTKIHYKCG